MSAQASATKRPIHVLLVTIVPDVGMGLDDAVTVKDLVEEAIRGSGIDNGADVKVVISTVRGKP